MRLSTGWLLKIAATIFVLQQHWGLQQEQGFILPHLKTAPAPQKGQGKNKALALWALKCQCLGQRFALWLGGDAEAPAGDHRSSPAHTQGREVLPNPTKSPITLPMLSSLPVLYTAWQMETRFPCCLHFLLWIIYLFFFNLALGLRHSCAHSSAPGECSQWLFVV